MGPLVAIYWGVMANETYKHTCIQCGHAWESKQKRVGAFEFVIMSIGLFFLTMILWRVGCGGAR